MYCVFLKDKEIIAACNSLRPMEVMFDKNNLSLSGLISMTNQSILHWTSLLGTVEDDDVNIRFEL